jgi:hypothetical protein
MKLPHEIIHALSFESGNGLWLAVHKLLDASIEAEVENATTKENKGEDRAWHCGRAASLTAFKDVLIQTRNSILEEQGRPPEINNPS